MCGDDEWNHYSIHEVEGTLTIELLNHCCWLILMCSACQPDGLGSGSESCLNCGGEQAICSQTGCNTGVITTLDMFPLLGHPCSSLPNGVGVVAGVLGTHSGEVGEEFKAADWEAEGWLYINSAAL